MWNVVHSECLALINSMTTRLSTSKKLTNGIAGPGGVAAAAGNASSVAGGGGGTNEGFPPMTSLQSQSEYISLTSLLGEGMVYTGDMDSGDFLALNLLIISIFRL